MSSLFCCFKKGPTPTPSIIPPPAVQAEEVEAVPIPPSARPPSEHSIACTPVQGVSQPISVRISMDNMDREDSIPEERTAATPAPPGGMAIPRIPSMHRYKDNQVKPVKPIPTVSAPAGGLKLVRITLPSSDKPAGGVVSPIPPSSLPTGKPKIKSERVYIEGLQGMGNIYSLALSPHSSLTLSTSEGIHPPLPLSLPSPAYSLLGVEGRGEWVVCMPSHPPWIVDAASGGVSICPGRGYRGVWEGRQIIPSARVHALMLYYLDGEGGLSTVHIPSREGRVHTGDRVDAYCVLPGGRICTVLGDRILSQGIDQPLPVQDKWTALGGNKDRVIVVGKRYGIMVDPHSLQTVDRVEYALPYVPIEVICLDRVCMLILPWVYTALVSTEGDKMTLLSLERVVDGPIWCACTGNKGETLIGGYKRIHRLSIGY